jgi:hypothetical protein
MKPFPFCDFGLLPGMPRCEGQPVGLSPQPARWAEIWLLKIYMMSCTGLRSDALHSMYISISQEVSLPMKNL